MVLLNPNDVKWVVLHTTDSKYGDVPTITRWHKERGWSTIGYHWVISGIYPTYESWHAKQPDINYDGIVHKGRSDKFRGAHVYGHNWETVGVVMVGVGGIFSARQLVNSAKLFYDIAAHFPNILDIKGHYEFTDKKTCPDLDMDYYRRFILPIGDTTDEDDDLASVLSDDSILNGL